MLTPSTCTCQMHTEAGSDHCGQVRHFIVGSPNRPGALGPQLDSPESQEGRRKGGGISDQSVEVDPQQPACGGVSPPVEHESVAAFPIRTRTFMPCISVLRSSHAKRRDFWEKPEQLRLPPRVPPLLLTEGSGNDFLIVAHQLNPLFVPV